MDNTKKSLSIFTMTIAILVFLVVVISTNVLLNSYIDNRAVESIQAVMENIGIQEGESVVSVESGDLNFMVDVLDMTAKGTDLFGNKRYISNTQKKIIEYVSQGKFDDDKINKAVIDSSNYYFIYLENPELDSNNGGEETKGIIIYTDVTPYKKMIGTMNMIYGLVLIVLVALSYYLGVRMGKIIEDSQDKLKKFFQNASHELKTPIMSIQGYAEGLKLGVIKDSDNALDIIMDESDKMAQLVEELLYISKLDSGQIVLKKEEVSIYDLIIDILTSHSPEIRRKNLDVKIDIEKDLVVIGDEKELSRAFGNIISNAVRYSKSLIKIDGKMSTKGMVLEIYNDGESIKNDDLEKIFERFYMGERGSTGIGLSMALDIIKLHKGKIEVKNKNSGVKFTIII